MSVAMERELAASGIPAARALHWCLDALRLWRRAPGLLFAVGCTLLLAEGLLQFIPWAGMTVSKLVVPILSMGILLGLDDLALGRRLSWSHLLAAARVRPFGGMLALAAVWGLGVFLFQQAVA